MADAHSLEQEYAALLTFMNAAPIGQIQASSEGVIDLINGVAGPVGVADAEAVTVEQATEAGRDRRRHAALCPP